METPIREATAGDAAALASLSTELGYPVDAVTVAQRLRGIAAGRDGIVLVALDRQGTVCGFAHALVQRLVIAEPFVDLAALAVADGHRGGGVGAALLASVEAWARGGGVASVRVRSNVVRERAHRFYLREGYVEKKRQAVFAKQLQSRMTP